jgi:hypothetical protein
MSLSRLYVTLWSDSGMTVLPLEGYKPLLVPVPQEQGNSFGTSATSARRAALGRAML